MGMKNYIPVFDLVHRGVYEIHSRNLWLGVWDVTNKGFVGIREKMGSRYLFTEYHYDHDPYVGTVRPNRLIEMLPNDISLVESFGPFCNEHRLPVMWVQVDHDTKGYFHLNPNYGYNTREMCPSWLVSESIPNSALFEYLEAFNRADYIPD